jgi:cytochrome c peroxidase
MRMATYLSSSLLGASLLAAALSAQSASFPPMPVPAGNPITTAKTLLGKALFFEEQISASKRMACATCHVMEKGSSDPRSMLAESLHPGADGRFGTRDDVRGSLGVIGAEPDGRLRSTTHFGLRRQVTDRRSMPVFNGAWAPSLFWDGRARDALVDPVTQQTVLPANAALESQALMPLESTTEMAHFGQKWSDVVDRLKAARPLALASNLGTALSNFVGTHGYPELFRQAFGTTEITPVRIAMAVATYERTLVSDQSRFDQAWPGNMRILTQQERRGHHVFRQVAGCVNCHSLPFGTDNLFHYTGVADPNGDPGLEAVTQNPADRAKMRTPSVRNVALRPPFFRDGSAKTLAEVVDFYDRGGDFNAPNKDPLIRPLNLVASDKAALVAFLNTLTDPRMASALPPFDRPTLWSESSQGQPSVYGQGTPGSGQITPRIVAGSHGLLGNDRLPIGIESGAGGAGALLALDAAPSAAGIPVLGIQLHLGLSGAFFFLPPVVLQGQGDGAGWGSWVLAVPNAPGLRGASLYAQALVVDPSGLSATEGLRVPLFD